MSLSFLVKLDAMPSVLSGIFSVFKRIRRNATLVDDLLFNGQSSTHLSYLQNKPASPKKEGIGRVVLVGAGPGDPDLLTIKAVKALAQADVVLFDWLVSKDILDLIPKHTKIEFVGKRAGRHSVPQAKICDRMVELALAGNRVVRLKGGDPAIFARTAEETDALKTNNISFSIVPGITAASGASAASGIPLTHRNCADSLRFVTATMKSAEQQPRWDNLVQSLSHQTLVFYMGLGRLNMISEQLIAHGASSDTPIALIDNATSPEQIVVEGSLSNICEQAGRAALAGPAVIIVGEVVSKRANVTQFNILGQQGLSRSVSKC